MESNWRWNVWERGMTGYWFANNYFPQLMLARLLSSVDLWIGRPEFPYPFVPFFARTAVDEPYQFAGTLPKLAPHFPYGWAVTPDH